MNDLEKGFQFKLIKNSLYYRFNLLIDLII